MHALVEPWSHPFMQRALLELLFVGVVGAVLGCWIVLYELAYSAESLAHALFPGLVAAALLGLPLLLGAGAGVLGAAAAVALTTRLPGIGRDVAVAVVVTTLFGLGVLLGLTPASPPGLDGLLFGDLLGVTRGDLAASGALAAICLAALAALHRPLLATGFDRGSARSLGARPLLVDLGLLALVAAAIVVGVQGLGNLLVLAALIGPAATARLAARRVPAMMLAATAVAVACALGGLYLSYYADVAAGAAVAGSTVAVYLPLATAAKASRAMPLSGRAGFPRVRLNRPVDSPRSDV
jgi:ABC-type Mn2+/Zn2+ transport system permease subunit